MLQQRLADDQIGIAHATVSLNIGTYDLVIGSIRSASKLVRIDVKADYCQAKFLLILDGDERLLAASYVIDDSAWAEVSPHELRDEVLIAI